VFDRFENFINMRGAIKETYICDDILSRGLVYCRVLVPVRYAFSRQLPDLDLPDMPFPGS
jgi:hypothetical protein